MFLNMNNNILIPRNYNKFSDIKSYLINMIYKIKNSFNEICKKKNFSIFIIYYIDQDFYIKK